MGVFQPLLCCVDTPDNYLVLLILMLPYSWYVSLQLPKKICWACCLFLTQLVTDSPFSDNAVGCMVQWDPGAKGLSGSWWCDNHHTHHLVGFRIAGKWGLVWRWCRARVLTCTLGEILLGLQSRNGHHRGESVIVATCIATHYLPLLPKDHIKHKNTPRQGCTFNSFTTCGAYMRQLINWASWSLGNCFSFFRWQCLIARNHRELFSFNRVISHLTDACCIDDSYGVGVFCSCPNPYSGKAFTLYKSIK